MTLSVKAGRIRVPDRILLSGVEGVGKTTFAVNAPAPIFIDTEGGSHHIDVPRAAWGERTIPTSMVEIYGVIESLKAGSTYRTLVIDTLDGLETIMTRDLCAARNWTDIEAPGYGKGYTALQDEARKLIASLEALRAATGMEIIITGHVQVRNFANPVGADYNRYESKGNAKFTSIFREWCDTVLFARHETIVLKELDRKGERVKMGSTGNRVVKTTQSAAWDAKNRWGLPPELPLSYTAYAEARDRGATTLCTEAFTRAQELLASLNGHPASEKARAHVEANRNNLPALQAAVTRLEALVTEAAAPQGVPAS